MLGGWAMIEAPYLVAQLQRYTADVIIALHVPSRTVISDQNGYLNAFKPNRLVHDVLMVERTRDNCYRRVGMGCITEYQLMRRLDESENCQMGLV